ncbi:L-Aspartase-like protein [Staphylotrichum tortipilum]|uniref:L-Aspartase-like protein n=1 Tax=Staphylotrichum tortipilum TaxID=2831512 RepID=A0AAN6RVM7_9PEZI|nr:L-Aspartase-like protein [Staphylotrichum longicolle]
MGSTIKNGTHRATTATPHSSAAYHEWAALQARLHGSSADVCVNGRDLTIADVVAVSLHKAAASLTDNAKDLQPIHDSVTLLERELAAGAIIYGVNTGFGGSADTRTRDFELLQSAAIQHLNSGILLDADKADPGSSHDRDTGLLRSHALPTPIVRAAMLIRCNSLMRGHSGVRVSVIESVMKLLALDMTPVVPLRGSISASGDLSTLSFIAGAVEGNPDIFVKVCGEDGRTKVRPSNEVLKTAGIEPVRLQAKEGLGITNGTAPSCAAACIAINQANQLALLTQVITAMSTEALNGTANNYHPFISSVRSHPGQTEAAANILTFLSGSQLCPATSSPHAVGLAQDRYPLRTSPQWIGPQLEDLALATRQVTAELNTTTDNPLIELLPGADGTTPDGVRIHHGGNFQAMALTSAMEKTLLALQNLGRLVFTQSAEIINNATNKGLPPNLSFDDPSRSFTCKGFDVNMAAYAAELGYLAKPLSSHVQVAEMANQSVNSMALVAARYAVEAGEVLGLMCGVALYVVCQALDLRCLRRLFGGRVPGVVRGVLEGCFGAVEDQWAERVSEAVLGRWDVLAHMDLEERARTAVGEALGAVVEGAGEGVGLGKVREYQGKMAEALVECFGGLREEFAVKQTTREYLSPASRVVYDFVRTELNVPLNRGVEDHPPLLLRRKEELAKHGAANGCNRNANGSGVGGKGAVAYAQAEEDLAVRGRTLGSMAGRIYEAVRRGELHDRIMKFGGENGMWVE